MQKCPRLWLWIKTHSHVHAHTHTRHTSLIWIVQAVVISVAAEARGDAVAVGAGKVLVVAGDRLWCGWQIKDKDCDAALKRNAHACNETPPFPPPPSLAHVASQPCWLELLHVTEYRCSLFALFFTGKILSACQIVSSTALQAFTRLPICPTQLNPGSSDLLFLLKWRWLVPQWLKNEGGRRRGWGV